MQTPYAVPAQAATVQINVRIDRSLKEAGDAVLAELGISPSQIIRDLWARLASREQSQEVLDTLGLGKRSAEEQAQIDRKLAVIERMTTRFEKLGQDMVPGSTIKYGIANWQYMIWGGSAVLVALAAPSGGLVARFVSS